MYWTLVGGGFSVGFHAHGVDAVGLGYNFSVDEMSGLGENPFVGF